MAIKVTLRKKKIGKGRVSLYLDFYPAVPDPETGKPTRREFLKMYIIEKPKTPFDKQHNADTTRIGESIRQKRENALNKPEIYSEYEKEQLRLRELGKQSFIEYFRKLTAKKKGGNYYAWDAACKYLEDFFSEGLTFSDINERTLNEFKEYLTTVTSLRSKKTTLSQNSAGLYFSKIKAGLRGAYKDDLIQVDLNARLTAIKKAETKKEYLTLEEVNKLVKTPCKSELLKRAALFSVLTGLRFSDIQKMTWGELEYIDGEGYFLNFSQKKTSGVEYYPISEQAVSLLNNDNNTTGNVFDGLEYSGSQNNVLRQWVKDAGITKKITFHCFRHTFATLQLFEGTDIYTVSKMLGHRDLRTTQVYAKIVDDSKRKAANRIKLDL